MYTMHLDHQPMIQCSSDNGTVREIAGWYQDGREFVWLEAYDQFVQRQSSEREKGEDAEGNDPQPTTLPQPPPPTLPSDMAHVSSQTNGDQEEALSSALACVRGGLRMQRGSHELSDSNVARVSIT